MPRHNSTACILARIKRCARFILKLVWYIFLAVFVFVSQRGTIRSCTTSGVIELMLFLLIFGDTCFFKQTMFFKFLTLLRKKPFLFRSFSQSIATFSKLGKVFASFVRCARSRFSFLSFIRSCSKAIFAFNPIAEVLAWDKLKILRVPNEISCRFPPILYRRT